jgi:SAM-dependent methyltransferase
LKYFIFLKYILGRDRRGLVDALGEDGAFGTWVYRFDGYPPCSRDLLDSVNELDFLDREFSIFDRTNLRILDIGAGYGRLAHRAAQALPGLVDYCCVDAVAESTFLSEYYLAFRKASPPARVLPLPRIPELEPESFDLAVNVHCFSECTRAAIAWWMDQLARLRPPMLFIVPNDPQGFLSLEADGSRLDYLDLVTDAGYRLIIDQKVFEDAAVGDLLYIKDRYCLFGR